MSAKIPETMLLSDLLKPTGYDCPDALIGKTMAEIVADPDGLGDVGIVQAVRVEPLLKVFPGKHEKAYVVSALGKAETLVFPAFIGFAVLFQEGLKPVDQFRTAQAFRRFGNIRQARIRIIRVGPRGRLNKFPAVDHKITDRVLVHTFHETDPGIALEGTQVLAQPVRPALYGFYRIPHSRIVDAVRGDVREKTVPAKIIADGFPALIEIGTRRDVSPSFVVCAEVDQKSLVILFDVLRRGKGRHGSCRSAEKSWRHDQAAGSADVL